MNFEIRISDVKARTIEIEVKLKLEILNSKQTQNLITQGFLFRVLSHLGLVIRFRFLRRASIWRNLIPKVSSLWKAILSRGDEMPLRMPPFEKLSISSVVPIVDIAIRNNRPSSIFLNPFGKER